MIQVGMIGLGHMGQPIARNLLKAGYALCAYDSNPSTREQFSQVHSQRAQVALVRSVGEAVEPGGIVLSMIPDDKALLDIVFREDGILSRLGPGSVHVSLSTVSPELAQQLALIYAERGASYISGTVVGRPDVAEEARLTIYVSGEKLAKMRVLPVLQTLGRVADLGEEVAAANIAKLATNSLILSAIAAMGDAAALIEGWGGDPTQVLELIAESPLFAGGAVYKQYGQMIAQKDFSSNALFPVPLGIKDARLIIEAAHSIRREMPGTEHAYQALLAAVAAGRDAEDWSVLAIYSSKNQDAAIQAAL
jgi:3-hydroxyisobutyrate dehydrogenase-like beta-hydroxyacid dehydrogenase